MKNTRTYLCWLAATIAATLSPGCTFDPPEVADAGEPPAWTLEDASNNATDGGRGTLDTAPAPDSGALQDAAPDAAPDAAIDPPDAAEDAGVDATRDVGPDAAPDVGAPDMATALTDCDGVMVDLDADPTNCGACGTQCDGSFGTCDSGACGCALPELEVCRNDQRCLDLQRDPNNCGTCDFACAPGAACVMGACECRPGLTLCNGECVDTDINPNHCGGCGMGCGGEACRGGTCRERCDLLDFRCGEGAGGTGCIEQPPRSGNHLYCHSVGQLTCGKRCGGDQICWNPPGFLNGINCYDYRPARGCETCPCDDCTGDEECLDGNGLSGVAWCVAD